MSVVLDKLWAEHANMRLVLRALERQLDRFGDGDSADFDIIQAALDYCREFPNRVHHPKEDEVLRRLTTRDAAAAAAVGDLEDEHRELIALTERFAGLVAEVLREEELPRDALVGVWREFLENYHRHMAAEERALFVEAGKVLTPEDWIEIGDALNARADPVFGAAVEDRFQALKADLEALAGDEG